MNNNQILLEKYLIFTWNHWDSSIACDLQRSKFVTWVNHEKHEKER